MLSANLTLLLFTGSFPYKKAEEDTFLNPELKHLSSIFSRVIIIPADKEGDRAVIPEEMAVEESFAKAVESKTKIRKVGRFLIATSSPLLYREIVRRPSLLRHPRAIRRMISYSATALLSRKWICSFIEKEKLDLRRTVIYTYWFDGITMGIGLAKSRYPDLKVLSRAHGCDVYFERHSPPYIPFRHDAIKTVDYLFFTSKAARSYTLKRFPDFERKYYTAYLGVEDPGFIAKGSGSGCFRVVSCSFLLPVKRLELLIKGLTCLGKTRKDQAFEWNHIGAGPLEDRLKDLAAAILPRNVKFTFEGYLPIPKILEFYQDNRIDIFINVSSSEGLPVSIMEAQSCGIPVIATAVGGNPEIVNTENGILISANPSPEEICDAIEALLVDPSARQGKARASRLNWEKRFSAETNYSEFSRFLVQPRLDNDCAQPE